MSIKQKNGVLRLPSFGRKYRKYQIIIGAVAGVIISAPIALPAVVVTLSGYAITAGTVAATLSQLTIEDNDQR